jgi:serine/threonine-protein kinase
MENSEKKGKRSLTLFDLAPGKSIVDRYKILRPHRQGGMSATFEVEDEESGERCELQGFPVGLFADAKQGREFAKCLEPWKGVDSPIFPRLRDLRTFEDGSVLIVTDFPAGQSLRSWLGEHGRMRAEDAVELGKSLLGGLVELHGAGLVHGDVKPATTFFKAGEHGALLVDGGITSGLWEAKHLGTRTMLIGTPYYAPLEQFTGDAPDQTSDIYAVATMLYEVMTGVLPWQGNNYIEVFQSKMQETPPRMAQRAPGVKIASDLEAALADGLRAKRRDRHESATDFLERLSAVTFA